MKCEEFEVIGLQHSGLRVGELDASLQDAVAKHAAGCPSCAAQQESWREARIGLLALRETTRDAKAPQRVEMRLRHEFGMRHRTAGARSAAIFAACALAAAAVLVAGVSWWNLQRTRHEEVSRHETAVPSSPAQNLSGPGGNVSVSAKENEASAEPKKTFDNVRPVAANDDDTGKFTLLPGNLPAETDEAAIVRVRMQRGALGALGLPVNVEREGEWIQVDLLVGNDGWPQAVRLVR